jgi:hypothetical protein
MSNDDGQFKLTVTGAGLTFMHPEGMEGMLSITFTEQELDEGMAAGVLTPGCFNGFSCRPIPWAGWPQRFWDLKTRYTGFDSV